MKKHLLSFALLILLMTQTKGQTSVYHPFPDSNAYWNESYSYVIFDFHFVSWRYSIFIDGDTVIGGNAYHKLFENGYECMYCPDDATNYFSNKYEGAIRQDTAR